MSREMIFWMFRVEKNLKFDLQYIDRSAPHAPSVVFIWPISSIVDLLQGAKLN